ncbi:MAG: exodeoxyribonuclease VII large subunit [Alphaproteobacteria bacterium]|nr:exodeoxyribonuclease VII large subunit [Alphaproteobacteria bacterium]
MKEIDTIFSVSEISSVIKNTLEVTFTSVRIKGEISNVHRHSSGHTYLSLKDSDSVISMIIWRGTNIAVDFKEGNEVIVSGKVSSYSKGKSSYQLIVNSMETSGEGDLLKKLEELKLRLKNEGLFDLDKKKEIPLYPSTIAVITSKTGSVLQDILHRLDERWKTKVELYPVVVQGQDAKKTIVSAFKHISSRNDIDTVILARGGGSFEDLFCFNDEEIVRSIYKCPCPVISAIGHETDTTLADFVADKRAPTPTGAAEIATKFTQEFIANKLDERMRYIRHSLHNKVKNLYNIMDMAKLKSPLDKVRERQLFLDFSMQKIQTTQINKLETLKIGVENLKSLLESYSLKKTMERGFIFATDSDGTVIKSVGTASKTEELVLNFIDGKTTVVHKK